MAYLTVFVSLTQAIVDSHLWRPFAKVTIQDEKVCWQLQKIVLQFVDFDLDSTDKILLIRFEKSLYFHCALLDLRDKLVKLDISVDTVKQGYLESIIN